MRKAYFMDGTKPNTGALDFRYLLDAPAGKHGFLKSENGNLVFEDGTSIKFFGTAMLREGCLPDHDTAEINARRIASAGLNLVRMHFMDGRVDLCDFGVGDTLIDYTKGNTRSLDEKSLDRLDYFIAQLKQQGIYVQLDTLVGRNFTPEGDQLEYEDKTPDEWSVKQVNIFNRRYVELQKEYDKQLLTHRNPYTGLRYVDDPCIAVVQIMNENSLMWNPGSEFGVEVIPTSYRRQFDAMWTQWLRKKYKTHENLKKAWTNEKGECAIDAGEHLRNRIIRPTDSYHTMRHVGTEYYHPYRSINGPARTADYVEFLTEVEVSFIQEMSSYLREIGVKCCINVTNLVRGAANAYTAGMFCDLSENDAYYNHPFCGYNPPARQNRFPMVSVDPRVAHGLHDGCPSDDNMVTRLSMARVKDKPFLVAEWNVPFPTVFASDAMLMMASYGAFQDWDGVCTFQYMNKQGIENLKSQQLAHYFTIYNDPAKWGQIGIGSAVFQEGLVQKAKNSIVLNYTEDDRKSNSPTTYEYPFRVLPFLSKFEIQFSEQPKEEDGDVIVSGGFTPSGDYKEAKHAVVFSESPYEDIYQHKKEEGAYLQRHREEVETALGEIGSIGEKRALIPQAEKLFADDFAYGDTVDAAMKHWGLLEKGEGIQEEGGAFCSDTGELYYGFSKGYFQVKAERFLAYTGKLYGLVELGNFTFDLKNERMSISLLARDGLPLAESKHILLGAVGENGNTGMEWDGEFLVDMGHAPSWVDQAEGTVTVKGASGGRVWALAPDGERREALPVEKMADAIQFALDTKEAAVHFELMLD